MSTFFGIISLKDFEKKNYGKLECRLHNHKMMHNPIREKMCVSVNNTWRTVTIFAHLAAGARAYSL